MNVLKKIEQLLPAEIEKKSFEIISEELSRRGIVLPEEQENITKRVIHTSADFEYTDTLTYSENSVQTAKTDQNRSLLQMSCLKIRKTKKP